MGPQGRGTLTREGDRVREEGWVRGRAEGGAARSLLVMRVGHEGPPRD